LSSGITKIYVAYGDGEGAFAALKSDGFVITWWSRGAGGDSSSVSIKLNSNYQLQDS
tara:strand:- start:543 stop:713 length:171 start_codon:yes stop_codon:yes gene_type:complete